MVSNCMELNGGSIIRMNALESFTKDLLESKFCASTCGWRGNSTPVAYLVEFIVGPHERLTFNGVTVWENN